MPCRILTVDGIQALVCGPAPRRKRCVVCGTLVSGPALRLCDYETQPGRTCSKPVCAHHAHHIEPDTDFCPRHAQLLADQARRADVCR